MGKMADPRELFLHELQDLYYAESALATALPVMASEASDRELARGLKKHSTETKRHASNLERVFQQLGEPARGERCPGIDGITAEHDEFMRQEEPTKEVCDLFLTGAAARAEHYEIAAYSGVLSMARGLGERECVRLLDENLREEKEALKLAETVGKRLARGAKQLVGA